MTLFPLSAMTLRLSYISYAFQVWSTISDDLESLMTCSTISDNLLISLSWVGRVMPGFNRGRTLDFEVLGKCYMPIA